MSQESRPMVAGGRSSGEVSIGGFRRLYRLGWLAGEREEATGVLPGPERRSVAGRTAAVCRWRDGGGRRGDFPTGGSSGSGRRTEEKRRENKEEEKRKKRKGSGLGCHPRPNSQPNSKISPLQNYPFLPTRKLYH